MPNSSQSLFWTFIVTWGVTSITEDDQNTPTVKTPMNGNMAHLLTPSPGYPRGFPSQVPFYHIRSPHLPTYQQPMFYGHPMQQRFNFGPEILDYVLRGYLPEPDVRHSGLAVSGLRSDVRPSGLAVSGLRITQDAQGEPWRRNRTPETSPTERGENGEKPWDTSALELPNHLEVKHIAVSQAVQCGVFTKILVKKGTRFGPYKGKVVTPSEIKFNGDNAYMWEIFKNGQLSHFLDGKNLTGNWMAYVNCARSKSEQNLKVAQADDKIYYESIADIPRGTELLVWYGDSYDQHMGIPTGLHQLEKNKETRSEEADVSEGFSCDRCGKMFAYRYYRDKHLKYTRCVDHGDRKFPCSLCKRSFEKKDRLRIHVLHVHEKHRPHSCQVCGKSFSQSSSLNKHIRVHSGERPYKCVYCNKAFTASSILRTHIRQHSGEKPFKCKHCGKAFASHAAHDSHVRRTHKTTRCDNSKISTFANEPSLGGSLSPTSGLMNNSSVSRSDTSSSGFSEIDMSSESGGDEIIDVEA